MPSSLRTSRIRSATLRSSLRMVTSISLSWRAARQKHPIKYSLCPRDVQYINVRDWRAPERMTEARRQARIAMLKQRRTFADLARDTGLSPATIHAALSNTCTSKKVRQSIVNVLQVDLWGLRPTERYLHVPTSLGMRWQFPT